MATYGYDNIRVTRQAYRGLKACRGTYIPPPPPPPPPSSVLQPRPPPPAPPPRYTSLSTFLRGEFDVSYPFDARLGDELTIRPGDRIEVDEKEERRDSLWLVGRLRKEGSSKWGYFYRTFVTHAMAQPEMIATAKFSLPVAYTVSYKERIYFAEEKPRDELECIICKSLADEPHQTGCCGHTVCFKCADEWRKRSNSCPNCREAPLDLAKDPRSKRFINSHTVYCSHYESGCEWKGSISELQSHLQSKCLYEEISCENEGCMMKVKRRNVDDHLKKTCSMRWQPCPCCQAMFTYSKIITDHYKECPSWPKRCPNHCGTEEKLMRSTLQDHVDNNCPEQVISCQFAEAGCTVRVKRKEMADHIQKAVGEHMTAMMSDYVKVKKEHNNLQKDYNSLKIDCELLKSRLAALEKSQGK